MRASYGGTWLIQLMVLFILLFAGYIILTIEYSKNVKVKNEMVAIIEKYDGLNEKSISLLNNYINSVGYRVSSGCEVGDGIYGLEDPESNELEEVEEGKQYYYCIKKYKGANTSYYYQVTVFYRFNLPVLGDISSFTIKGTTTNFQPRDEEQYCMTVSGPCRENPNLENLEPVVKYTVTFDYNDGTGRTSTQEVRRGRRADPLEDEPTRSGYRFVNWTLNDNNYNFYDSVNSDITLKAKWEPISN